VTWQVLEGDCLDVLRGLPDGLAQTCVTSPPYFGLRDYGTGRWDGGDEGCDHAGPPKASDKSGLKNDGRPNPGRKDYELDATVPYRESCGKCGATRIDQQVGLESSPDAYVERLVEVFREVRRVLRDDGTVWLNLGDSYYSPTATQGRNERKSPSTSTLADHGSNGRSPALDVQTPSTYRRTAEGLKPKDLLGIPWMVAFALRNDGWYLRSDIIWSKPNPMPESVTDRPTKAHEYVFLLSKRPRYFYDADAIREGVVDVDREHAPVEETPALLAKPLSATKKPRGGYLRPEGGMRNKRSVWQVATQPFPGAHFAVFPPRLIEPCVLAGAPVDAVVLDMFCGAGTTGVVATRLNRSFVGVELNPEYAEMARQRIRDDAPLMNTVSEAA
jgi:DNA modification methylase